LTHTFFVLVTVGLGHGVYRKLHTLIGVQRAEQFEKHWFKKTVCKLIQPLKKLTKSN